MIASLSRNLLARLCAVLLLAAVGLQAGAPMPQVLERAHGSAFSASTGDVALSSVRRADPVRQAAAPQPVVPPKAMALQTATPVVSTLRGLPAPRPDSTGPPALEILVRQPAPRGPPAA